MKGLVYKGDIVDLLYEAAETATPDDENLLADLETKVNELNKVEIQAGDRAATVKIDHMYTSMDGNDYMNDYTPDTTLEGAADNGSLTAFGNSGKLDMWFFYEYEGKQYGLGTFTNPSGETANVGLVRP